MKLPAPWALELAESVVGDERALLYRAAREIERAFEERTAELAEALETVEEVGDASSRALARAALAKYREETK